MINYNKWHSIALTLIRHHHSIAVRKVYGKVYKRGLLADMSKNIGQRQEPKSAFDKFQNIGNAEIQSNRDRTSQISHTTCMFLIK